MHAFAQDQEDDKKEIQIVTVNLQTLHVSIWKIGMCTLCSLNT